MVQSLAIGRPRGEAECPLWVISGHRPPDQRCPLCPRKQSCSASKSMSALCHSKHFYRPRTRRSSMRWKQECPLSPQLRSLADIRVEVSNVRFSPESGHAHRQHRCPLSAISRHSDNAPLATGFKVQTKSPNSTVSTILAAARRKRVMRPVSRPPSRSLSCRGSCSGS